MSRGRRRLVRTGLLLLVALAPGCRDGGLTLGLSGCDFLPPAEFARTPETTIDHALRGAVTTDGVAFLTAHRELLSRLLFSVDDGGQIGRAHV